MKGDEENGEPKKPLLPSAALANGDQKLTTPELPSRLPGALTKTFSDVTAAVRASSPEEHEGGSSGSGSRGTLVKSLSSERPVTPRNLGFEDGALLEPMGEELAIFMDKMRDDPDVLKSIVSRGHQAWDREELSRLRKYRDKEEKDAIPGLRAFEGPVGYKRPRHSKRNPSLKDQLFGLREEAESEATQVTPSSTASRQTQTLRDDFTLGPQVLTDLSLLHLAVYCHPDQAVRHLDSLLKAAADINTPASYPAGYTDQASPASSSARPSPGRSRPASVNRSITRTISKHGSIVHDPEQGFVTITALHIAVCVSRTEVVDFLLQKNASPDSRATFDTAPDYTALHLAAAVARRRSDQARMEQTQRHYDKQKMLGMQTAHDDAHEVISLLLGAHADIRAVDGSGRYALRMLSDLAKEVPEALDKWGKHMEKEDFERLRTAIHSGPSKRFESEPDSQLFIDMVVRLPEESDLKPEEKEQLANQSEVFNLHSSHRGATLSVRELGRLFRKDFRVVGITERDGNTLVDCHMQVAASSGSRTRTSCETHLYRFPRFLTMRQNMPDSSAELSSDHVQALNKFCTRKAWRCQGVVGQGHTHFKEMIVKLRQHKTRHARLLASFNRSSTSPNFGVIEEEEESDSDDNGVVPPRPKTTPAAAINKARTEADLEATAAAKLAFTDVDLVLDMPLPPGARYKKTWIFKKGCLIHYAVACVLWSEDKSPDAFRESLSAFSPEKRDALENLQLVLNAKADVHARAYYSGRSGAFCTTTALHMVATTSCCEAAVLLLKAGCSIEVTSTMNGQPYYHPLHNAAYSGSFRLCKLLLLQRANPNTTNIEGRTGLHLAVKHNHIDILRHLISSKGNVVMKDRQMGPNRYQGGGLTAMDMCSRATRQYSESERAEIMAMLAPSFNGVNSILYDICTMSTNSDAKVGGVLIDQALKPEYNKAEVKRAMTELRARAVQGQKEWVQEGVYLTPLDYVASIIENAPKVGVRVLKDLLLADPDMEDNVRGALPSRANLKPRHTDSWLIWRRYGWFKTDFITAYEPDSNADRHDQEQVPSGRAHFPCWLHREDAPEKRWHRDVAPLPGNGFRKAGDSDVHVKALLLGNVIDVRILRAFAQLDGENCEVFSELVVQAVIGATFDQAAGMVTLLVALEEAMLFALFMQWASLEEKHIRWAMLCWCMTAAIAMKEAFVHTYSTIQYKCMGFGIVEFFFTNKWSHGFKIVRLLSLFVLVLETRLTYQLDKTNRPIEQELLDRVLNLSGDREQSPRKILGTNIVIQGLQIVLLLRNSAPEAEFGRHILSILHSFGRLWAILVVMICFFFSFSFAFFVMNEDVSFLELMEKVWRGLYLGDGDGLDFMEGKWESHSAAAAEFKDGHKIEWLISCLATFLFTICLLNISIAVFQTEYEKALGESYLHFWQHRSFYCMQTLLGPRWPWGMSELGKGARAAIEYAVSVKYRFWSAFHWTHRRLLRQEPEEGEEWDPREQAASPEEEENEHVHLILLSGILCCFLLTSASLALFMVRVHRVFSSACLALALTCLQALATRGEALGAKKSGKQFFLWVCHRSDFSPSLYIESDVEKDDILGLKEPIIKAIEDLGKRVNTLNLEMQKRMEKIENRLEVVERRAASSRAVSGALLPVELTATAKAKEEVQEAKEEVEAVIDPLQSERSDAHDHDHDDLGLGLEHLHQDSMDFPEWAAAHLHR